MFRKSRVARIDFSAFFPLMVFSIMVSVRPMAFNLALASSIFYIFER